jgi:hypothetical protein
MTSRETWNQDEFEKECIRFTQMLQYIFGQDDSRCRFYNGWINGKKVIILGYMKSELDTAPICVLMTDELFDMLDVDGQKIDDRTGEEWDAEVGGSLTDAGVDGVQYPATPDAYPINLN